MAISKDLVVTIKSDKAKPEDKMFIYRKWFSIKERKVSKSLAFLFL